MRRGVSALALAAGLAAPCVPAPARAAVTKAILWTARAGLDGAYVSNVFPGYQVPTPDTYAHGSATVGAALPLGARRRLDASATATVERYDDWSAKDNERYDLELGARAGAARLRARGRYAPRLLLFLDAAGGARYRDRQGELRLDYTVARVWTALGEFRSESQAFDPAHAERTGQRTRWTSGVETRALPRTRLRATFDNEHSVTADDNYSFYTNEVGIAADLDVGPGSLQLETTQGIRNYFPSSFFATNYRRHDRTQEYILRARWPLVSGLDLLAEEDHKHRESTRAGRSYRQNTLTVGLAWRLGR